MAQRVTESLTTPPRSRPHLPRFPRAAGPSSCRRELHHQDAHLGAVQRDARRRVEHSDRFFADEGQHAAGGRGRGLGDGRGVHHSGRQLDHQGHDGLLSQPAGGEDSPLPVVRRVRGRRQRLDYRLPAREPVSGRGFRLERLGAALHPQPLRPAAQGGIFIDKCYDVGRIENVHFWPFWKWDEKSGIREWMWKNSEAFIFARTDWEYVFNTFIFGYKIGYRFTAAGTAPATATSWGSARTRRTRRARRRHPGTWPADHQRRVRGFRARIRAR